MKNYMCWGLLWLSYASHLAFSQSTSSPTPTVPARNDIEEPRKEEVLSSWALLILTTLLFIVLFLGYVFRIRKIWLLHETIVSICIGVVVGFIIMLLPVSSTIQEMLSFNHKLFFNLLLPPIILRSGYELNMKNFFRNLGSISMFAFVGTFVSTIVIGTLTFLFTSIFERSLKLAFLDCIIFGAILSSTDPVTVVALFEQLHIDRQLYAIIFGESILNDSVAIVLFGTLGRYQGTFMSPLNVLEAIGTFTAVFVGSVTIGIFIALCCALLLKFTSLRCFPSTEASLILLMAYCSYILSNASEMSGIVSLLFCAITLKHYAYDNMSPKTRQVTLMMARILGKMSENFIFIYLGVSLFSTAQGKFYVLLIIFTMFSVLVARYCSVFPLARILNKVHARLYPQDPNPVLPENYQKIIWWSGLRGAIAFALSYDVAGPGAGAIRTTTLVICVTSVICFGGTTALALQRFGLVSPEEVSSGRPRTVFGEQSTRDQGTESERHLNAPSSSSSSPELAPTTLRPDRVEASSDSPDGAAPTWNDYYSRVMNRWQNTDWNHWWLGFDNTYIRPVFTKTDWKWGERLHPDIYMQYQRERERNRMSSTKSGISATEGASETNSTSIIFDQSNIIERTSSPNAHGDSTPIVMELDAFITENQKDMPKNMPKNM